MASFDQVLQSIGAQVVPPDTFLAELIGEASRFLAPSVAAGRRSGKAMHLRIECIDPPGFNAFAGSFNDGDAIAIFRDVASISKMMARAMVSGGELLPKRHTQGMQAKQIEILGASDGSFRTLNAEARHPLPDPVREGIATQVAAITVMFIIFHEYSHIYNGHVDLHASTAGLHLIFEMEAVGRETQKAFQRETLEWDADTNAVQMMLEWILEAEVTFHGPYSVWAIKPRNRFGTTSESLELAMAAFAICYLLFSSPGDNDLESTAPRSHPHSFFRLINAQETMRRVLAYRTGRASESIEELASVGEATRRAMAAAFPDRERRSRYSGEQILRAFNARLAVWEHTWAELHPALDRVKRGGLLAPARPHPHPAFEA